MLKEILGTQANTHYQLVSQVFWGLLACEIQLQKSRESTELTTIRKIKEMIRTRFSESPMGMLHHTSSLLHWSLVFSFTATHTNGMFAALLADRPNFGDAYLNVIELRSKHLMRHMVAAFLLGRSNYQPRPQASNSRVKLSLLQTNALETIALPMIMREKNAYSDSFTQFTEALLEDFEFEEAIALADKMKQEASQDILLRPHASEIRRQALLYVYEVQARLTRQPSDLNAYCQEHNVAYPEIALPEVEQNMGLQGLVWNTTDGATI